MKLDDMVRETIFAKVPAADPANIHLFKLHSVEAGGLWLESQAFIDALLEQMGVQAAPKTPVVFVPYHQIVFVLGFSDAPSFSEKALGV